MDSLLANYATSDEEEDEIPKPNSSQTLTLNSPPNPNSQTINQIKDKPTSLFSSLPKPKSSISQFSLPIPKSDPQNPPQTLASISPPNPNSQSQNQIKYKPTSLFSSLPKPTSSISQFSLPPPKSDPSNPKKVIQLKIPLIKPSKFDDDDDDDDREREGRKMESFVPAPSVTSFLSNLLPAAKNSSSTLGALPSALGSGRRSIVETKVSLLNPSNFSSDSQMGVTSNEASYSGYETNTGFSGGDNSSDWVSNNTGYGSYDGNVGYGNYEYYQGYNSNWDDGSAEVAQSSSVDTNVMRVPGKRGRTEIPTEIVEVKQDDLTKNRPREDQVKSTGIAFGPAYQPVSTKGKPSKLQKRKHQIGSLYFDMRQKESELAERRSKGFLTKAETQAKYGW